VVGFEARRLTLELVRFAGKLVDAAAAVRAHLSPEQTPKQIDAKQPREEARQKGRETLHVPREQFDNRFIQVGQAHRESLCRVRGPLFPQRMPRSRGKMV